MRRFIPYLLVIGLFSMLNISNAQNQEANECATRAKSCILSGTAPQQFSELLSGTSRWYHYEPAISTGYYFVTNQSLAGDYWRPKPSDYLDTIAEPEKWFTVLSGPRQKDPQFWDDENDPLNNDKVDGGYWFFRNPASNGGNFYDPDLGAQIDSTDNAICGPMRIGFPSGFRFNGIAYDSFYVSTNGIISLTNSRYLYNKQDGSRVTDPQTGDAYNRESMDWYVASSIGRPRSGNGLSDVAPDDYGYRFATLGNAIMTANAGIRGISGPNATQNLSGFFGGGGATALRSALIAPFWGDMHLSQYSKALGYIDPFGKVMYRRTTTNDKLYITIFNIAPSGAAIPTQCGNYTPPVNGRFGTGEANVTSSTAQVILDAKDSSITIIYRNFSGSVVIGNCAAPAETVFRYNASAGVRGWARHANYNRKPAAQDATPEYEQYTQHWHFVRTPQLPYPYSGLSAKYKQWQNTLRVVDIQYRVRNYKLDPVINDLSFSVKVPSSAVNNYELLAGEDRLGGLQPVALIQNLTNDIQGPDKVNYVAQDLEFRSRFRIINEVSGRLVYNRLTIIDSTCLALPEADKVECTGEPEVKIKLVEVEKKGADYNVTAEYVSPEDNPASPYLFPGDGSTSSSGQPLHGIPSYGIVQVFFPPFEPSEFVDDHIGRLRAYIIAVPTDPEGNAFGDEWPFDDTTSVNVFVLRRLNSFYDDGGEFHLVNGVAMPSVWKWVNIDAQMAVGDVVSKHPLPPRGNYTAQYVETPLDKAWLQEKIEAAKFTSIASPVIKMNRKTLGGQEPAKAPGGDEIRSFPIDMRGKLNSVLSVSFQRIQYDDNWERGYGDNQLVGPEPRSILTPNPLQVYSTGTAASDKPDEIVVEMANNFVPENQPLERLKFVTNIVDKQWRIHFTRKGGKEVTDMPALGLYGAGGYRTGFWETDPDSSMSAPTTTLFNGLRHETYDDGVDEEYRKFFVAIPDTFINFPHDVAQNFRFRIRVMADNDQKPGNPRIPDDDDDFFVDNIRILFEDIEATDIEVSSVKIRWPYTRVPATQATKVPVLVSVTNNTSTGSPVYNIKLKIFKGQGNSFGEKPIYCRTKPINVHNPRLVLEEAMPSFDAKAAGPGTYRFQAIVLLPGDTDKDDRNDTTYFDYNIQFGDDFAYDPVNNPSNNVEGNLGRPIGRGLNFFGYRLGGGYNNPGSYDHVRFSAGETGGTGSGQMASKFVLQNADTVYGYKAFFTTINQAPDYIQFAIHQDAGNIPGQLIQSSVIDKRRGEDDVRVNSQGEPLRVFGEYVDYRLPQGVILQPGTYWMVIAQLGETGLELGGSTYRGGMRTISVNSNPQQPDQGTSGISLNLHKEFRTKNSNGQLLNNNFFAYENTKGSGEWQPFTAGQGNPSFAHLHHYGYAPGDNFATQTLTRGFWIPMMRPYFGNKAAGLNQTFEECPDDVAIEFAYFRGNEMKKGFDLYWETVSEIDNSGFYLERKLNSQENESDWTKITYVPGAGSGVHNGIRNYSYYDANVQKGIKYDYRVRSMDIDGSHDCHSSGIVTLQLNDQTTFDVTTQVSPNPFMEVANIEVNNPNDDMLTIEIVDIHGNVVNTLHNEITSKGLVKVAWNGNNETGAKVAQGTYIYRVTSGAKTQTGNINYIQQ